MMSTSDFAAILDPSQTVSNFYELFVERAIQLPEHTALIFDGIPLSYAELLRRSDALAELLCAQGVADGDIVGISLARGFDLVTAMLAALKTGAVFLPIDPNYPAERKLFMLRDATPALLVMEPESDFQSVVSSCGVKSLILSGAWYSEQYRHSSNSSPRLTKVIDLDNPAYVIYTSGSTGQPKGAINTQRGLLNLALAQREIFHLTTSDRVLQFASFSFDASIWEIALALGSGATLILARQPELAPGPSLGRLLLENKVTHITLPPSVLAVLPEGELPSLRTIVVAGEICPIELARRWVTYCRFFNAYGVSEAAVCSTIREYRDGHSSLPIGKAIAGTQLWVLDQEMREVSVGEVGELYIGGAGVGAGYINRTDLTKERFVSLNLTGQESKRFYRTGDRVRLLLDQSLEYVGREDNQVKVRGFRIELDEISAAIEQFDAIIQSAVVVSTQSGIAGQLVGFFKIDPARVSESATALRPNVVIKNLRAFLNEKLPPHMIPSYLVPIDNFPLAPTGKIDLAALRARSIDGSRAISEFQEPRTATERRLAKLCGEILGFGEISIRAAFVDLGGDSLQAAKLAWRIEEEFSIQIGEWDILQAQSLELLAQHIDRQVVCVLPELSPIQRAGAVDPTPPQEIFGLLQQLKVDTSASNCCAAFELNGEIDTDYLQQAYRDIFQRHEGLRLRFLWIDGLFKLAVHDQVKAELNCLDYSDETTQATELKSFFAKTERITFDLENDLLVKCYHIKLAPARALFVLIAHHAIFDAWSLHVFMQDLLARVLELKQKSTILLPLRIQYLDYVDWLHRTLAIRDETAVTSYLSKVFAKPLKLFDLKNVKPRPALKSGLGENLFLTLTQRETAQLYAFSDLRGITPFMVCVAVLKSALFLHSGQNDITIGGPVSIRYHRELEQQIGLYGSAYIARTVLAPERSIEQLLQQVRHNLLAAYKSQVFSLTGVLQQFDLGLDLSRTAPYDISVASHMFDLPICQPEVLAALDLSIRPFRFPLTTSFFDFEITFHLFGGEIELEVRYDSALYGHEQIACLTNDFRTILLTAIHSPNSKLMEVLETCK